MAAGVTAVYIYVEGIAEMLDPSVGTSRSGGVESQIAQLAVELASRDGVQVVLITDVPFQHPRLTVRTIPWYMRRGPYGWSQRLFQQVARALFADPLGVSPAQKYALFPRTLFPELIAAARSQGCVTGYWVAGDSLVDDTPIQKSLPHVLERQRYLQDVDLVMSLTQVQQRHLSDDFGIDSPLVTNLVAEPSTDWLTSRHDRVLWVGRPQLLKRPLLFVEIARALPDHSFRMLLQSLPDNRELKEILAHEAERLPNLEVVYDVPYAAMGDEYAAASAVVGTSVSEGLPQVYLEAGASGVPVFSLEVNPNGMYPTDAVGLTGYCAQGDLHALIEQLGDYLATLPIDTGVRQAIHDEVLRSHAVDTVADQILAEFAAATRR